MCFCFSSLSLNSFAVEEDVIDEGWIIDEETGDCYIPSNDSSDFIDRPSFFLASRPNFPSFNPNDLPWEAAPDYIQKILYNTPFISTSSLEYVNPWKLPFVLVLTNGSVIRVIVGINLMLGTYFSSANNNSVTDQGISVFGPTGVYVVCHKYLTNSSLVTGFEYSCCYEARFDFETLETTVDWHQLTSTALGDRFLRFTGSLLDLNVSWDYYCFGGNNIGPGRVSSSFPISTSQTSSYPCIFSVTNASSGFAGGAFVYKQEEYWNSYFSSFIPQTYEEKQSETQKGILSSIKNIWESVKSLPELIGDKLKSLFIPSSGYFDTYVSDFQDYFKDRFGLLYELPDEMIGILKQFIAFSPSESDYSIHFPKVVMPVLDEGEWYDKVLISETDISFDFLEQGAFKTMYTMYRSVVWMIFVFALVNLIIRKSDKIFSGGGG